LFRSEERCVRVSELTVGLFETTVMFALTATVIETMVRVFWVDVED
jgi:hypothetical protein